MDAATNSQRVVGASPRSARVFLRHVLRDIAEHPTAGPALAETDLDDPPAIGSINFRIGIARARVGKPLSGGPRP